MKRILLVSGSEKSTQSIALLTSQIADARIDTVRTADEASLRMESGKYDAMIVNTPLNDGQGIDVCVHVCEKLMYPVLLMTNEVTYKRVSEEIRKKGIIITARPVDKKSYSALCTALLTLCVLLNRIRSENRRLKSSLEENKLVARAKSLLMKDMNMTEDQAHRFIEKQAMDLRTTKRNIAQNIINTYFSK
ncbi:MAG: ANTAR domain-containing response regulator [Anaerovoracaceae bacterium]|jgi:AmiR/NasT family two-component response regulator